MISIDDKHIDFCSIILLMFDVYNCMISMFGTKRNNKDIRADMLYTARGGARKTRLVYQCNLNFGIVKKYIRHLIDKKLLYYDDPNYISTEKAEKYLSRYEALNNI